MVLDALGASLASLLVPLRLTLILSALTSRSSTRLLANIGWALIQTKA